MKRQFVYVKRIGYILDNEKSLEKHASGIVRSESFCDEKTGYSYEWINGQKTTSH